MKNNTINTIHFDITEFCNYSCEYCYQGINKIQKHISEEIYNNFFVFLDSLKEPFNVHLIGGEPFLYPKFFEMIQKIISYRGGNKISVTTNFSHSKNILSKFLDIAKGKISFIEISMHLTQIKDFEIFIEKLLWFKEKSELNFEDFQLNSILLQNNFEKVKELKQRVEDLGFKLNIQRVFDEKGYLQYSEYIEKWIEENNCIDIPLFMVTGKDYSKVCALACRTGNKFFKILIDGKVTRCFSDNEYGYNLLGNMSKSYKVKILKDYTPCLSVNNKCRCYAGFIKLGQIETENKKLFYYNFLKIKSSLKVKKLKFLKAFYGFLKKISFGKMKNYIRLKEDKINFLISEILIYKY